MDFWEKNRRMNLALMLNLLIKTTSDNSPKGLREVSCFVAVETITREHILFLSASKGQRRGSVEARA